MLHAIDTFVYLPDLTSMDKVWKVNLNCKQCSILGITLIDTM